MLSAPLEVRDACVEWLSRLRKLVPPRTADAAVEPAAVSGDAVSVAACEAHRNGLPFFFIEAFLREHLEHCEGPIDPEVTAAAARSVCCGLNVADPSFDLWHALPAEVVALGTSSVLSGRIPSRLSLESRAGAGAAAAVRTMWTTVLGPIHAHQCESSKPSTGIPPWKQALLDRRKQPADRECGDDNVGTGATTTSDQTEALRSDNLLENCASAKLTDTESPLWKTAVAVRGLAGGLGSSGVLVVVMESAGQRSAVVLKPASPSNIVAEHFGGKLVRAFGLPAPVSRPAAVTDRRTILNFLSAAPDEQTGHWRTHFRKGGHQWLLSEWASASEKLYSIGGKISAPQDFARQLGVLACVDAVLNNYDRVPAAHMNSGNIDNVLFRPKTGDLIPIDHLAAPIRVNAGQQSHLDRIHALVTEAKGQTPGSVCSRVDAFLRENAGLVLGEDAWPHFLGGVCDGIKRATKLGADAATRLRTETEREFCEAGVDAHWLASRMAAIDDDFVQRCLRCLSDVPFA